MNRRIGLIVIAATALAAGQAHAEMDLFSKDTVSGLIDLRAAAAEGERSWTDGGFGKLRYGGSSDGDVRARVEVAEAHLVWKPQLHEGLHAVVDAIYQPDQDHAVDLSEGYFAYSSQGQAGGYGSSYGSDYGSSYGGSASAAPGYDVRIGLFYPHISMEHTGDAWTVADTITPSAINSWVGEEVKVVGVEGTLRGVIAGHQLAGTAGLFGYNDTSATLLTFRGWALHDLKATASGDFPLPPLTAFIRRYQAPTTEPVRELDDRAGYYFRIDWRPPAPVAFNLFLYDNAGDRETEEDLQWAWDTRFVNAGASWQIDERTRLQVQALDGESVMGSPLRYGDIGFQSAYVLASRKFGEHALTGRVDWFSVSDESFQSIDNNEEDGWAATVAWRHALRPNVALLVEAVHVSSDRPARSVISVDPEQTQTAVQTSLRLSF